MKDSLNQSEEIILTTKPRLSVINIILMSFGFLGIQFGFALQGGNMSRIFESLGASKDAIPMYWIAAPLTGLLIQPIIGYFSDKTWHPVLGRRRPYFLIGAILASAVLFFVPNSSALWMAAGSLWVLDASINISMEPFRALVADKLPPSQRSFGFVVQALIIGVGTWIASALPWLVNQFGVPNTVEGGGVPPSVKLAFAIGAVVFMATILITIFFTKEYSPKQVAAWTEGEEKKEKKAKGAKMPLTMKKLGVVQFFSWFAFFSMWAMATPALTSHIFNSPAPVEEAYNMDDQAEKAQFEELNQQYNNAADLVSRDMGMYGLSSMGFALILTMITAFSPIN
ncbi:MAG: MFS transporter, partial [Flavobacteriales bacterium]|nr:MFS transporter [Flavobacteriales bacterium]